MRQSAMRILQQFLPRIGRFVEPGFDDFLVVGDVLFPANEPDLAFFLGNGGISFIEAVARQRDIRECPAYILLYQFSPKDTGQSKVK